MAGEHRPEGGSAAEGRPQGRRRQQIMKAAERLFARGRIHEVTLDQVARAARVGKGTIYRYFEDKDDLFFQTATSGFDDLCALLQSRVPGEATFETRLLAACEQIVEFFDRRRHLIRMMQAEEGHALRAPGRLRERWMARRQKLVAALAEIIAQGAGAEIRADIPSDVLAAYLLGILRTRGNDLTDVDAGWRTLEVALDLFWSGAAPRGSRVTRESIDHGR
jgi:AcrR family transcriptional regulator